MTEFQALLRALEARGKAVAKAARARAAAALIAAAEAELPGLTAYTDEEMVVLAATGIRARAFGSRRALPDAQLQSLVRHGSVW
ncbi:hypothetical protein KX816_14865 [Sphingosinicellaceae bacterium]|nr:hypothetical protein KX816_14865 [Sphingosinicellaceae bacterium]